MLVSYQSKNKAVAKLVCPCLAIVPPDEYDLQCYIDLPGTPLTVRVISVFHALQSIQDEQVAHVYHIGAFQEYHDCLSPAQN